MVRLSLFFFLLFSSFAVTGALMPLYLKDQGYSTEQIGLQLALGSVIAVFGQPFFGFISDRIQSTKKVLLFVVITGLFVSFFYFSAHSFYIMLLLFIALNFFISASGPLIENMTIDYSTKNNKNYGLIRLWGDVGIGASSVLVGLLVGWIGIKYLGFVYAFILLVTICVGFTLKDGRQKTSTPISIKSIKKLLTNRSYLWFLLLGLVAFVPSRMNDVMLTVYLSDLGASESQIGAAWMVATFASAPLFILMGRILKRYQEITLVLIASALYSVRWLLYSLFDDPFTIILLQLMNGITFPLYIVAALFFVTKIIPEEIIATGQTIFIAIIVGIGGLIGSGGGGWFMQHYGAISTYQLGAFISIIGTVLCVITIYVQQNINKQKHYSKNI